MSDDSKKSGKPGGAPVAEGERAEGTDAEDQGQVGDVGSDDIADGDLGAVADRGAGRHQQLGAARAEPDDHDTDEQRRQTPEKCDPAEQAKEHQALIWKRIYDDAQAGTRHTKASIDALSSELSISRLRIRDALTLLLRSGRLIESRIVPVPAKGSRTYLEAVGESAAKDNQ